MPRDRLNPRHDSITLRVAYNDAWFVVTFGLDSARRVREAFCAGFKVGSDHLALANDACVLLSRALQFGDTIEDIAQGLGENRPEGATHGPPASIIGAIARAGADLEKDLQACN